MHFNFILRQAILYRAITVFGFTILYTRVTPDNCFVNLKLLDVSGRKKLSDQTHLIAIII